MTRRSLPAALQNPSQANTMRHTQGNLMPHFICTACGMQYAESDKNPNLPPTQCIVCEEERQYVPPRGQSWTTLAALAQSHMNGMREYDSDIIGIGAGFAIGQRALLPRTAKGNVL